MNKFLPGVYCIPKFPIHFLYDFLCYYASMGILYCTLKCQLLKTFAVSFMKINEITTPSDVYIIMYPVRIATNIAIGCYFFIF